MPPPPRRTRRLVMPIGDAGRPARAITPGSSLTQRVRSNAQAGRVGPPAGLDVEVVEHLEVVGDEAAGAHQHAVDGSVGAELVDHLAGCRAPIHGSGVRPALCHAIVPLVALDQPSAPATACGGRPQLVGIRVAARRGCAPGSEWAVNSTRGRSPASPPGARRRRRRGTRRTPARWPRSAIAVEPMPVRGRRRPRAAVEVLRRPRAPSSAGRARAPTMRVDALPRRARRPPPRSSGRRASGRARPRYCPGARSSSAACSASRCASVRCGQRGQAADRLVPAGEVGELLVGRRPAAADVGVVRQDLVAACRGVPYAIRARTTGRSPQSACARARRRRPRRARRGRCSGARRGRG